MHSRHSRYALYSRHSIYALQALSLCTLGTLVMHSRHSIGELACETAEDDFHVDNLGQCQGPNLAPYRVD